MSITPIFPALTVLDVENVILSQMDARSLLHLSFTQHAAHDKITNEMFKALFPGVFSPHIQKHFPDCGWKMTSYFATNENPTVVFSENFLRSSVIYQAEKQIIEQQSCVLREEYQAICGSGFQHPHSAIDKAWKAYEAARDVAQRHMEDGEPIPEIVNQRGELLNRYHALDHDRVRIEGQLGTLSTQLDRSEKNVLAALLVDQYFIRSVFWISKELYVLEAIDIADAAFAVDVMRNSFDVRVQGIIYEILYHQCAKGVIEDSWAEKHCQTLSHEIQNICNLLVENLNDFGPAYMANPEAAIDHYVAQNKEAFSTALPIFQKLLGDLEDTLVDFREYPEVSSLNFRQIHSSAINMMLSIMPDLSPIPCDYFDFFTKFCCPLPANARLTKEYVEEMLAKRIEVLYLLIGAVYKAYDSY